MSEGSIQLTATQVVTLKLTGADIQLLLQGLDNGVLHGPAKLLELKMMHQIQKQLAGKK